MFEFIGNLYGRLHIMTSYVTKYESYRTIDQRGVAFTKYNYIENA